MESFSGKVCTVCGLRRPLDGFYRKCGTKDGRDSRCRDCKRAVARRYRESPAFLDRQSALLAEFRANGKPRRCSACGRDKPWTNFYASRSAADGLSDECKTCNRVRRAIRWSRPEVRARHAAYLARPEVRELRRQAAVRRSLSPAQVQARRRYRRSPIGKIRHAIADVKWRMGYADDPSTLDRLKVQLDLLDSELHKILCPVGDEA